MKKLEKILLFPMLAATLTGCPMPWEKDTDVEHFRYCDEITGKFVLHDSLDKRYEYHDTYFEFNGAKGVFSMKYYVNGELKREGKFEKVLTYRERIGSWSNNLHFNVQYEKNKFEHISTYAESFDPLNQFRILEEYNGFDSRYFLSELPYVMGTYVREGAEYKEEAPHNNPTDYTVPTETNFTSALNGKYELDENTYFYFMCPNGWELPGNGYFYDAYFQYFAPGLEKPLEGFASGYKSDYYGIQIRFDYLRNGVDWGKNPETKLYLGYPTYKEGGIPDTYVYGTVDFSDGELKSFTFEKISRSWSEGEWNKFLKDGTPLPDPIQYDYVGGTYTKAEL